MEPAILGPYLLLALGSCVVIAAVVGHFRQLPAKSTVLMWVFGLAFLGTGAYGPAFLADYAEFVKALNQVTETPGAEQVADFLDRADKAGVTREAREAILVETLGRQVAGGGSAGPASAAIYNQVLKKLPPESENLAVLQDAKTRIDAQAAMINLANRQLVTMAKPPEDSGPRSRIDAESLAPLTRLPEDQLRAMRLDPETLKQAQARAGGGSNP